GQARRARDRNRRSGRHRVGFGHQASSDETGLATASKRKSRTDELPSLTGHAALVGDSGVYPQPPRGKSKKLPVPRTGERREAPAPGAASRDRAALSACPRR